MFAGKSYCVKLVRVLRGAHNLLNHPTDKLTPWALKLHLLTRDPRPFSETLKKRQNNKMHSFLLPEKSFPYYNMNEIREDTMITERVTCL